MKATLSLISIFFFLVACESKSLAKRGNNKINADSITLEKDADEPEKSEKPIRVSVDEISEITDAIWVEKQGDNLSLSLHFIYDDILSVEYSPECWLSFPYKFEEDKMIVYWDNNIDTKYDFDIVKAIEAIDKKYIGETFMILEIENDTTLKSTYPLKDVRNKINLSNNKRTFFPDKFNAVQEGDPYD